MPEKYDKEKYDTKKHKKWMAGWTSIYDILGKNNWLLVIYKWGYDHKYCYELLNLKKPDERFFINETENRIYDFDIDNKKLNFEFFADFEDKITWKKASTYLY
jgi:hypothetical protein